MRLKIVPISIEILNSLLSEGFPRPVVVVQDALPGDATLVAVRSDGRTVFLTYQSATFDDLADGQVIPKLEPIFRSIPNLMDVLASESCN